MKTFIITLAQNFHCFHPRSGEPTGFKEKFLAKKKIHTIRANYKLWKERFSAIEKGEACLSVRQWSGKPYRSKQLELAVLTNADGIGIEKLTIRYGKVAHVAPSLTNGEKALKIDEVAENDGLELEDWMDWFKQYDTDQTLAIIHFTPFRY